MAELIDKNAIHFRCRYGGDCQGGIEQCFKCLDYVCDAEDIQDMPTVTEAEIRAKAIDEFAEKLKKDLDIKYCFGGIDSKFKFFDTIDEIAEQLKGE